VIEIRLLGRFSARRSGNEIPPSTFGGRRVRSLIRVLLTRRGEFVSQDVLAEALWPRRMPANPGANLRVLVNRARGALCEPVLIVTGPGGYSFARHDRCVVDAEVFLAMVQAAHEHLARGQAGAALGGFRAALDVWGGEPLAEDAYEDWAQEYGATLGRAHLQALEEGVAAALAVRDPAQAVTLAERAAAREPLRESAHMLLARALAASGNSAAALHALDTLRHRLAEELGIEVSPDLLDLEDRIVRGEPLAPATRGPMVVGPSPVMEALPFVGREEEVEAIVRVIDGPMWGTVVVSGVSGMGKSRLLAEVAMHSTAPVLTSRAFLPERDEPWSLGRSLLREALALDCEAAKALPDRAAEALADIVPELAELRTIRGGVADAESRRALALAGGVRLLEVTARRAVVLVDDLQWADATSLSLLGAVATRVRELGLVLAYRSCEIPRDGPVASFLSDLRSLVGEVVTVQLKPLSRTAISLIVADGDVADAIEQETDGTPLAVSEAVRTLSVRGVIEADFTGRRWHACADDAGMLARETARAGQRRALQVRVERQSPPRRETLSLLALLGRETPARVLASARKVDQATLLDDLDTLGRAGLVRLGDGGWSTAHDLISETVVEYLDRAERGRLHQMLAHALEAEGGDSSELARHLAGAGDRAAAAAAFAEASRRSLDGFAAEETVRLADAGLELVSDVALRATLLEVRGEAQALRGDLDGARTDLRGALDATSSRPKRARILTRIATLTSGSDAVQASDLVELALTQSTTDPAARAEALAVAAMMDASTSRLDRAEERAAEALTLFEQLGDVQGVASVLDAQATSMLLRGRVSEAAAMYDRVARLHRDGGSLLMAGTPRVMRGWALTLMGRADEGLSDAEEALELERTLGQTEGECICLYVRAEALAGLGRVEDARSSAEAALAIGRRIENAEYITGSLRALAIVHEATGQLDDAEAALLEALEVAKRTPLLASLAAGRLASVYMARGDTTNAETYAMRCLAEGAPFVQYDARLVLAELALARGEPDAEAEAAETVAVVEAGGCVARPAYARVKRLLALAAGRCHAVSSPPLRERKVLMFTDIVRSTNLVETLGDEAWGHLLRWHDESLRSLFVSYDGHEVKHVGDGFFVVFDRAGSAVDCAVAIQRALDRNRRDHGFAPQVRIGLHEATAVRKGRDYQGRGVHEAARIGALAGPGEILASRSVAASVVGGLRISEPRMMTLRGISGQTELASIEWR
jgi:DNA-binding SARP family transcriptional activator/class 3 adenylate cyclase